MTAEWFADTLPDGLDAAIGRLGPRYHAIVVDEGQDFDGGWLASLEGLLYGGKEDVLYVFHDPAQAIFRDDQIGELGLTEFPLDFNCRNAKPIHDLIVPLAKGGLASMARRQRRPRRSSSSPPRATPRPSRRCARCSTGWSRPRAWRPARSPS